MQDTEHVGLLQGMSSDDEDEDPYRVQRPIRRLQDVPDLHWPEKLKFLEGPVKKVAGVLNPPIIGAIIAVILGVSLSTVFHGSIRAHASRQMVGPLNHAFLSKDGTFYASITSAVKNLGDLLSVYVHKKNAYTH